MAWAGLASNDACRAQQVGQLTADRKAKARAAKFACSGTVGLHEALEQLVAHLLGDADPGIGDTEAQFARPRRTAGGHLDAHAAGIGELDRIADEIDQDLPQPRRVGHDMFRHAPGDIEGKRDALL